MSEAILSQTVMPMGPEVRPVLTVIPNTLLQGKEDCASGSTRGFEKPCNDIDNVPNGEPVQYLSLTERNTSCQGNAENLVKRITILNFDPSKGAQKTFVCSVCNKSFDTKELLHTHLKGHNEGSDDNGSVCFENNPSDGSNLDKDVVLTGDEERKYGCSICDKTFKTRYDVNVHIRIHTGEKPYECSVCGKRMASNSQFSKHVRIHSREGSYTCHSCGKTFHSGGQFHRHMRTVTADGEGKGPVCVKQEKKKSGRKRAPDFDTFDETDADLVKLSRIQEGDKPYECVSCGKRFNCKSDIRRHVRVHTGIKPFKCYYCVKTFSCSSNLYTHLRRMHRDKDNHLGVMSNQPVINNDTVANQMSNGFEENVINTFVSDGGNDFDDMLKGKRKKVERKFKCLQCNKHFCTEDDREAHMEFHKQERPFKCAHCHQQFFQRYELKNHLRKHTGEKPFLCNLCGDKFHFSRRLYYHMRKVHNLSLSVKKVDSSLEKNMRIHTGENPFECVVCGKRFKARSDIRLHVRIHTGEKPYKCSLCLKTFSSKSRLNKHSITHSREKCYHCSVCREKFSNRHHLLRHMKTHKANLINRMDNPINSSEKRHDCRDCGKEFSCSGNLVKHMRIHTGEMPYKCLVCQKKFRFSSNLSRHMGVFKGKCDEEAKISEEPKASADNTTYECFLCGQKCNGKNSLAEHVHTHKGNNPHSCSICNQTFSFVNGLYRHMRKIHPKCRIYKIGDAYAYTKINTHKNGNELMGCDVSAVSHLTNVTNSASMIDETTASNSNSSSKQKQQWEEENFSGTFEYDGKIRKSVSNGGEENPVCNSVYDNDLTVGSDVEKLNNVLSDEDFSDVSSVDDLSCGGRTSYPRKELDDTNTSSDETPMIDEIKDPFGKSKKGKETQEGADSHKNLLQGKKIVHRDFSKNLSTQKDYDYSTLDGSQESLSDSAGEDHESVMVVKIHQDENLTGSILGGETMIVQDSCEKKRVTKHCEVSLIKLENDSRYVERQAKIGLSRTHHKCSICGKTFGSKRVLSKHVSTHKGEHNSFDNLRNGEEINIPKYNDTNFIKENLDHAAGGRFKEQVRISQNKKPYKCKVCNKAFAFRNSIYPHMRTHTGDKPFKCSLCPKSFNSRYNLNNHLRVHTGQRPFKCLQCSKTFRTKCELNIHLRTHTGEKPYKCLRCNQAFRMHAHLKTHLRIHTGERPNKCSHCQKKFNTKFDLTIHERIHTGERPYQCSLCGKTYISNSVLHRHMRSHTGEKPYKCSECDKAFMRSNHLAEHLKTHTGIKPYECSICCKSFYRKADHAIHMRIHTGERPFQCSECGKMFYSNSNFNKHKRTHTNGKRFDCNVCGKKFAANSYLSTHMKTHEKNSLVCPECGEVLQTSRHLKVHMRNHEVVTEKVRQCSECGETFDIAINFYKHMMQIHEFDSEKLAEIAMQS